MICLFIPPQPLSQVSHSVISNSLQSHGLQHARFPCPSLTRIHVHQVSDTIQPSQPLSARCPQPLETTNIFIVPIVLPILDVILLESNSVQPFQIDFLHLVICI